MNTNDSKHPDPGKCVVIERGVGDRVRVIDVTGKINCSKSTAEELIRREHLTVVTRSELRAMASTVTSNASWEHLLRDPVGRDDGEVRAWKQVARLQERFRDHSDSWAWWSRFCSCNSATTCVAMLELLVGVIEQTRSTSGPSRDWLGLLRNAIAIAPVGTVSGVRTALMGLTKPKDK